MLETEINMCKRTSRAARDRQERDVLEEVAKGLEAIAY